MMEPLIESFREAVLQAAASGQPLCLRGSGSKDFYGGAPQGAVLDLSPHRGIVHYEPKELVLTARAGTPLGEIERALHANRQMLPFEPPSFSPSATLGGCVASGLSGPRRAYQGAVRDFVLGVRMLDGRGDELRFGGQVMKNVAGYDVSRLMAGSLGTLGILLEVSLKVLPRPAEEASLGFEMDQATAIETMNRWAGQPLPLSATCYDEGRLTVRLSGAASAVEAARRRLGGEPVENGTAFWEALREQRLAFFAQGQPLWRVSLPPASAPLDLPGRQLIEWGGALRWLSGDIDGQALRGAVEQRGGQATLFRGGDESGDVFHPLSSALLEVQRRIKRAFDPHGIFNPGRMYRAF